LTDIFVDASFAATGVPEYYGATGGIVISRSGSLAGVGLSALTYDTGEGAVSLRYTPQFDPSSGTDMLYASEPAVRTLLDSRMGLDGRIRLYAWQDQLWIQVQDESETLGNGEVSQFISSTYADISGWSEDSEYYLLVGWTDRPSDDDRRRIISMYESSTGTAEIQATPMIYDTVTYNTGSF
jgi:hypothetical protein